MFAQVRYYLCIAASDVMPLAGFRAFLASVSYEAVTRQALHKGHAPPYEVGPVVVSLIFFPQIFRTWVRWGVAVCVNAVEGYTEKPSSVSLCKGCRHLQLFHLLSICIFEFVALNMYLDYTLLNGKT